MKLIVFDLFGTLIRYSKGHNPYRRLIRHGQATGRPPANSDARIIMSSNKDLRGMAEHLGIVAPNSFFEMLEDQIAEDISSLGLFDDVIEILTALVNSNTQIAICSNLAMPYGRAISSLLGDFKMSKFLSFELACIKPDIEMYKIIPDTTNFPANEILFIGDSFHCDFEGPINFGFQARHLIRSADSGGNVINDLKEVLRIVKGS